MSDYEATKYSTLIFGYGDVVKHKYFPAMEGVWRENTAFVETNSRLDAADKVFVWNSDKLDALINSGRIQNFIIASTPDSHSDILNYLFTSLGDNSGNIYVEKPFLPSSLQFTKELKLKISNCPNLKIACIDHYVAKPVVNWLHSNFADLSQKYGKVTAINYASYEKKGFGNVETFKIGYALEHGVHALPCFEHILGAFYNSIEQVTVTDSTHSLHTLDAVAFMNKFSFNYKFDTNANSLKCVADELSVSIKGGKLHSLVDKTLSIQFEKVLVTANFQTNQIFIGANSFFVSENDSYNLILRSIYKPNSKYSPCIDVDLAMKSVRLIELGITSSEVNQ